MKKNVYSQISIEMIYFQKADVISTSGFSGEIDEWDTEPDEGSVE